MADLLSLLLSELSPPPYSYIKELVSRFFNSTSQTEQFLSENIALQQEYWGKLFLVKSNFNPQIKKRVTREAGVKKFLETD